MANTFLTPDVIARQVLANLYENLVMLPLVHTGYSGEFQAKVGDTVNVRKPAVLTASLFDRGTGIVVQNATETSVPVKLDKIADISLEITDESALLELESMDAQIATPAAKGLAQYVDAAIIAHIKSATTAVAGVTPSGQEWNKPEVLIEAGRQLDIKKVPNMDRHAVIGPTARANWLNSDLLKQADKSGSTDALRRGSIGDNLFGFDAFMTQNIVQPAGSPASGQPTTEVGLAFHETAFTFTSVPLPRPLSAGTSYAIETYRGISLRTTIDRDHVHKQDVISFDVLYGVATLDADRSVLLRGALAS
ncbi:P22 phage major capsid protein family protein [Nocardia brasiliensis]|uniref:P22 phage major capsid protein family protein n=1 Tax=Nocardia brasiliensis TaxID=37326 RepID=UPI0024583770|nr:P22 phage major capsid protein family protein [Nocardia brasiliensis]